ncbi:hypothetical protein ACFSMW_06565 [Virgibacillus halophilus]|uniref:hypothetical protein n=1 Tax=Tigheibacillus halophilus TaxID=361280 RepID=UPI003644B9FF
MEQKIEFNDVVESLTNQVAGLSRSIAYNEAVIKQKDIELAELNKELDKMKEEQVKRLDEEAEKENKKK